MGDAKPTRSQGDLAEMLETLLDKGVVVNADVAVTVGDTELLGVKLRAAIASFETAAEYGLEFPSGTDMERVADAAGVTPVADDGSRDGQSPGDGEVPVRTPSTPAPPTADGGDGAGENEATDGTARASESTSGDAPTPDGGTDGG
jgi:hypothetical protein